MPANSAPRGSASAQRPAPRRGCGSRPLAHAAHPQPLLLGLRDVQALEVEREAGRRQRAAEAAHELVVAPAAAEDVAERRVVDLEDRAGVVAEVAQQAEVELDPVGDPALARAPS